MMTALEWVWIKNKPCANQWELIFAWYDKCVRSFRAGIKEVPKLNLLFKNNEKLLEICETLWVHLLCNVYCHKCLRIYYNKLPSSSQMLRIIINDSFGFVIAIKNFHYQNLWWENSFPKICQYTGFYVELYSLFVFQKLLACNVW